MRFSYLILIIFIYFVLAFVSYIVGFRGSRKLRVGEYSFTKNKVNGLKTYWSCARAGTSKCKARVLTIQDGSEAQLIIKYPKHNHDPF